MNIQKYNERLLQELSYFLNNTPKTITKKIVEELSNNTNLSIEDVYKYLLATFLHLDVEGKDREFFHLYFHEILNCLDTNKYKENPYYKHIHINPYKKGNWEITYQTYEPYELFVCNDMEEKEDGRILPKLGYFKETYSYLCVLENNREWMLITPNEIETMQPVIDVVEKDVLTYGLGLGYFAYMCSLKENVTSITVIEKDKEVISLFETYILPQFESKEKIRIIEADAKEFAKTNKKHFDHVFVDLWHDVSDGLPLYKEFKMYEKKHCVYHYWIEKTLKCYLDE